MSSDTMWTRRPTVGLVVVLAGAALAHGCGAASTGGASSPSPRSGARCAVELPEAAAPLPAPDPFEPPVSRIVVSARAELELVQRELSRYVPTVLDSARGRDIGAPGRVTYTVRRGPFSIRADGERIAVSTPIQADVSVCKPFGPFCPTYGRCRPQMVAEVSVPVRLTSDYDLGPSRAGIATTHRCVIAAFDATPEIERMARGQMGAIQARVDHEIRPARREVSRAWKFLHVPVALGAETCLRATPKRLVYGRPTVEDGVLAVPLGAETMVEVHSPCGAEEPSPAALPAPAAVDDLAAGVDLRVPVRLGWEAVSTELARSMSEIEVAGLRIVRTRARGTKGDGQLVLDLTLAGEACGVVTLRGEPWLDPGSGRVRIRHVRLGSRASAEGQLADLVGAVEQRAAVGMPVDVTGAPDRIEARLQELGGELPDPIEAAVTMDPTVVDRVVAAPEGLVAVVRLPGRATVTAR